MSNQPTKAETLAGVQALIAGTQKLFPNGQFTLGNTTYTTASIVQLLTEKAAALTAMNVAQQAAKDAVAAHNATEAKVTPVLREYVSFLRVTFRNATTQLGEFGLQPPKARTPLTAEKRVAATAKARATRVARGTTSKKQKLAIKGDVAGVVVTPFVTPPPVPAPAASQVAPAPPAGATTPASTTTTAPAAVVTK